MYKVMTIAVLVIALISASALADSVEGIVLNKKGNVIAGANVEVEGTIFSTITDSNGRFFLHGLREGKAEFHISAVGFAHLHQDIIIDVNDTHQVTFILTRSPIEVIDVVATPIHMSATESASPVSVLAGESLRRQQASSLGDSIEKVVGVHTNFHAKVASTPIIRGLSGPRVLIAQNGLDVSDVSRVGPDHAVASEASTAEQIEVLRGPATLFYGSGAVGGVVNVVDGRIPKDNTTRGEWLLETNSIDDQQLGSFNVTTGIDSFAFYADGYSRQSNDYEVPVAPEAGDHVHTDNSDYVVENSAEQSHGITLGSSYLFSDGYIGAAVEKFNREYGIPGHSHGESESVFADLEQTRIQLQGEFSIEDSWLKLIQLRGGYTDYQHAEIEGGNIGTVFENETQEMRLDLVHTQFFDWNGAISLHYKNSSVVAAGSEAFTPPSDSETLALAIMEEKHFGDVLLQLGARIERVTLNTNNLLLPAIAFHDHQVNTEDTHEDEHDHGHEHEHEAEHSFTRVFEADHEFTPISLSAGVVWDVLPGYNIGFAVSRSERAPSASELMSFGAHIGTGTYEVGALFDLHDDDSDTHIGLTEQAIDFETANNIDLTFRKTQGDLGFVINGFYNQIDNYYYQTNTGLFAEDGHDHDHAGESQDEHEGELPVFLFQTDNVILHGFEAQVAWQATETIKVTALSDYVRARLKNGGDLPRTPPLRFGTQFSYENEQLSAHLDITRYQKQDRIAPEETATNGYTLVDASVSYGVSLLNHDIAIYLKGRNLTNTEARVHSSFLKDLAPRPGRSIAFGLQGEF